MIEKCSVRQQYFVADEELHTITYNTNYTKAGDYLEWSGIVPVESKLSRLPKVVVAKIAKPSSENRV